MIRKLDDKTMVGAQIRPGEVPELKRSGVTMIVCNRPDGEEAGQPTAADVEQAATDEGVEFRWIPISRGLGPGDAAAMKDALDDAGGKVFAYCRTGNRSTLAWAAARRAQGAERSQIEAAAAEAGVDLTPIGHLL